MAYSPENIGHVDLWTARMQLDPTLTHRHVQRVITAYVGKTGISVVGYVAHNPRSLTLLRWPDTRPDYHTPSMQECDLALDSLAATLRVTRVERGVVPVDTLHTMMGTRMDGYNTATFVPLATFERPDTAGHVVTPAHMVSARAVTGAKGIAVEPYGEPVCVLTMPASVDNETAIHDVGEAAGQWHYAIERGVSTDYPNGRTDFFETHWAQH